MHQQSNIEKWQGYIEVILPEIRRLRYSMVLFSKYSQIARAKRSLLHNYFSEWLPHAYVAQTVMTIRRLTDEPSEQYKKVSLVILLREIGHKSTLLTREKFIAAETSEMHKDDVERELSERIDKRHADAEFTKLYGSGRYLETKKVNADLRKITKNPKFKKIREFANKNYAHTDEDRTKYPIPTYGEMHTCIKILTDIFLKYHRLITGVHYDIDILNDTIRKDVKAIFSK